MNIRLANAGDVETISKLVLSLSRYYLKSCQDELPPWFVSMLSSDAFLKRLHTPSNTTLVGELNEEVVAYGAMNGSHKLYHLFVLERFHGEGLSRKMWTALTAACPSDYYELNASVYAIAVYEKFGFIKVGNQQEKDGIQFQPMILNLKE